MTPKPGSYMATLRCDKCQRATSHWAEGQKWYCCACADVVGFAEALSDLIKTADKPVCRSCGNTGVAWTGELCCCDYGKRRRPTTYHCDPEDGPKDSAIRIGECTLTVNQVVDLLNKKPAQEDGTIDPDYDFPTYEDFK